MSDGFFLGAGAIASAGGAAPDGFLEYIASLGVGAGQATWTSQGTNTADMLETGTIGLNSADVDFNGEDSLDFPGTDYYQIDETDLARVDQQFIRNGTTDWWNYCVCLIDSGADEYVWANQTGVGVGVGLFVRTGSGFARINVANGSTAVIAQTPNSSIPIGTATVIFTRFIASTNMFGVRAQGGTWVEVDGSPHPTGDANGPLTLFSNSDASLLTGGKIAEFHFRKSLPGDEAALEAALVAKYGL